MNKQVSPLTAPIASFIAHPAGGAAALVSWNQPIVGGAAYHPDLCHPEVGGTVSRAHSLLPHAAVEGRCRDDRYTHMDTKHMERSHPAQDSFPSMSHTHSSGDRSTHSSIPSSASGPSFPCRLFVGGSCGLDRECRSRWMGLLGGDQMTSSRQGEDLQKGENQSLNHKSFTQTSAYCRDTRFQIPPGYTASYRMAADW